MYRGSNEEKAQSAKDFLDNMRKQHKGNYGVETSVDSRIGTINMHAREKNWKSLEKFYHGEKEEGYLAGWEYPSK